MANQTTDVDFEKDVVKSDIPVLVDFWAEWCGPCRQLSPLVDELAKDKDGKIKVLKVNIDENPNSPQQYGVRGIPTLIIFKNGKPAATKVGSMPKNSLYEWVDSIVGE